MKHEIGLGIPANFMESWPGELEMFSHFEFASGVPHALFLITTLKENGLPNACFNGWSCFTGDGGGFYAVMPSLGRNSHTFRNILRDEEFCINFLAPQYYDACGKTIEHNGEDDDELAAGGFTAEPAVSMKPPRIAEAFLTYECRLRSHEDLSGKGITEMVIGQVVHAAVSEAYYCKGGVPKFMYLVHEPRNTVTGEGGKSIVARLEGLRNAW